MEIYKSKVSRLPYELHTVGGVLFSIVLAVTDTAESENFDKGKQPAPTEFIYSECSNIVLSNLEIEGVNATFHNLFNSNDGSALSVVHPKFSKDVITCEDDDQLYFRCVRAMHQYVATQSTQNSETTVTSESHDLIPTAVGLYNFERQAVIRGYIARALKQEWMPFQPRENAVERGMKVLYIYSIQHRSA